MALTQNSVKCITFSLKFCCLCKLDRPCKTEEHKEIIFTKTENNVDVYIFLSFPCDPARSENVIVALKLNCCLVIRQSGQLHK